MEQAADFYAAGARYLHLVDLDGAKSGRPENEEIIRKLSAESGLLTEAGGGIRDPATVERYLDAGVGRVILGTAAAEDPDLVRDCTKRYGDRIAVGVDSLDGRVRTRGWLADAGLETETFIEQLQRSGVRTVICTDISRDGMQQGVNEEFYARLRRRFPGLVLIASGGVSSLRVIETLRDLGLDGAIIGKALYTGAIDLKEALAAAGEGKRTAKTGEPSGREATT